MSDRTDGAIAVSAQHLRPFDVDAGSALRDSILLRRLAHGASAIKAEVARHLAAGRAPSRKAAHQLERDRLTRRAARYATVAVKPTPKEIRRVAYLWAHPGTCAAAPSARARAAADSKILTHRIEWLADVGFALNTGQIAKGGSNLSEVMRICRDGITHIHIKD